MRERAVGVAVWKPARSRDSVAAWQRAIAREARERVNNEANVEEKRRNKHSYVQTTSFAPALWSEDEIGVLHGHNPACTM